MEQFLKDHRIQAFTMKDDELKRLIKEYYDGKNVKVDLDFLKYIAAEYCEQHTDRAFACRCHGCAVSCPPHSHCSGRSGR